MKLDLHIHSNRSRDAFGSPREILAAIKRLGLDGCAITDHNAIEGSLEAGSMAKDTHLIVVRGVEISSAEGHVLAYGVSETVPRGLSVEETVDRIHALGGVAVAAHPKRFPSGMGLSLAMNGRFEGIEVLNGGSSRSSNAHALSIAKARALAQTGGSDAHRLHEVGRAYTVLDSANTEDDVISLLSKGLARAEGRSRSPREGVVYAWETLEQWVKNGFKRL